MRKFGYWVDKDPLEHIHDCFFCKFPSSEARMVLIFEKVGGKEVGWCHLNCWKRHQKGLPVNNNTLIKKRFEAFMKKRGG